MNSVVVEEQVETPEEAAQFTDIGQEAPAVEQPQEQQEEEIPSKFKGKSMGDVLSSYENLEKELGRKGQELGELRKLTDEILKQQLTTTQSGVTSEPDYTEEVDFFDDPDRAINKAIENNPKIRAFEEQQAIQAQQATTQQIKNKHPDYLDVVQDVKFQEWVQESPIRTQLYVSAHNYDYDSAVELIGNWKERALISNTTEAETNKANKREEALKAGAGVTKTSSESTAGKKIYRRADLIRLKTTNPDRYESLQDEILSAYADGRVK